MRIGNNVAFNRILRDNTMAENTATYKGIALKTVFYLLLTIASAVGGLIFGLYYPETYLIMLIKW